MPLKCLCFVIAFRLVFERLPKDKEVINSSSQNWSTFKEEFDSLSSFFEDIHGSVNEKVNPTHSNWSLAVQ